jgi:protein phosphatase
MRPIQLPDPCLVVLVGPAGSGKSTLAARHFRPEEILSSDAYRQLVSGDAADQRATGLAFRRLHGDLAARLRAGKLCVVDATNVTVHARRNLLARASDAGIPTVAIVLDLSPEVVHARNAGRPVRVVDPAVVDRHLAGLRDAIDAASLTAEGFDDVVVLDDPALIDGLRFERSRTRR